MVGLMADELKTTEVFSAVNQVSVTLESDVQSTDAAGQDWDQAAFE